MCNNFVNHAPAIKGELLGLNTMVELIYTIDDKYDLRLPAIRRGHVTTDDGRCGTYASYVAKMTFDTFIIQYNIGGKKPYIVFDRKTNRRIDIFTKNQAIKYIVNNI